MVFYFIEDDLNHANGDLPRNSSDPRIINVDSKSTEGTPEKLVSAQTADINTDLLKNINRFHQRQKKGSIDVWWLFDDGGE